MKETDKKKVIPFNKRFTFETFEKYRPQTDWTLWYETFLGEGIFDDAQISDKEFKIASPFRKEQNASFSICLAVGDEENGKFKDFGDEDFAGDPGTLLELFYETGHIYGKKKTNAILSQLKHYIEYKEVLYGPIPWEKYRTSCIHLNTLKSNKLTPRGISTQTQMKYDLGHDGIRYTLPVYNSNKQIVNIRRYDPNDKDKPKKEQIGKMINTKGYGWPMLYPLQNYAKAKPTILCGGEWDALILRQWGFNSLTNTHGVHFWNNYWNYTLSDEVYICFDIGEEEAAQKVADSLLTKFGNEEATEFAQRTTNKKVYQVMLPKTFNGKEYGKDINDFALVAKKEDFEKLLENAVVYKTELSYENAAKEENCLTYFLDELFYYVEYTDTGLIKTKKMIQYLNDNEWQKPLLRKMKQLGYKFYYASAKQMKYLLTPLGKTVAIQKESQSLQQFIQKTCGRNSRNLDYQRIHAFLIGLTDEDFEAVKFYPWTHITNDAIYVLKNHWGTLMNKITAEGICELPNGTEGIILEKSTAADVMDLSTAKVQEGLEMLRVNFSDVLATDKCSRDVITLYVLTLPFLRYANPGVKPMLHLYGDYAGCGKTSTEILISCLLNGANTLCVAGTPAAFYQEMSSTFAMMLDDFEELDPWLKKIMLTATTAHGTRTKFGNDISKGTIEQDVDVPFIVSSLNVPDESTLQRRTLRVTIDKKHYAKPNYTKAKEKALINFRNNIWSSFYQIAVKEILPFIHSEKLQKLRIQIKKEIKLKNYEPLADVFCLMWFTGTILQKYCPNLLKTDFTDIRGINKWLEALEMTSDDRKEDALTNPLLHAITSCFERVFESMPEIECVTADKKVVPNLKDYLERNKIYVKVYPQRGFESLKGSSTQWLDTLKNFNSAIPKNPTTLGHGWRQLLGTKPEQNVEIEKHGFIFLKDSNAKMLIKRKIEKAETLK